MTSRNPDTIEAVAGAGVASREPPAELLDLLQRVQRPLLAGHVAPDADSIGSCAAICVALRERGRDALVALPGGRLANKLRFLVDLAGRDVFGDGAPDGRDALIVFDTTGPKRLNIPFDLLVMPPGSVVNIDHHISNLRYGGIDWIDADAGSSAELACRLLKALGWPTTPTVATLLFAGLHADTLGFCAPTTTAAALASAADLVRAGADAGLVGEHLYRSQNRAEFDLARRVYDRTRLTDDGRIAYSVLSYADIAAAGCTAADIDDQVSIPRCLDGARVAILFTEGEQGVIRINLRGKGRIGVLAIARQFGGGGHVQSAGVRVRDKPLQQVVDEVLEATGRYLDHELT